MTSNEMQAVVTLAEAIYTEVFGTIDDERFRDAKITEMVDWLREGDVTGTESIADLGAEWAAYDAEDVKARVG